MPLAVRYRRGRGGEQLALDAAAPSSVASFAWARGPDARTFDVTLGGQRGTGRVVIDGDAFHVFVNGEADMFVWCDPLAHAADSEPHAGRLSAPMPGKVIAVLVEPGQAVEAGAPLIVMEAMKMEHTITAPSAGVVREIRFALGDQVSDGAELIALEVPEAAAT